jgi:hypothetical protein
MEFCSSAPPSKNLPMRLPWLIAGVLVLGGLVAWWLLVETDRDRVEAVTYSLARAAEAGDTATLLASIDGSATELRGEAERIIDRYKPSEVTITKCFVEVDHETDPPTAVADVIIRARGVADGSVPGSSLVGGTIHYLKRGETWLVTSFEFRRLFQNGFGRQD